MVRSYNKDAFCRYLRIRFLPLFPLILVSLPPAQSFNISLSVSPSLSILRHLPARRFISLSFSLFSRSSFSPSLLESFYFLLYFSLFPLPPSVWPYILLRRFAVRTVLACSSFSLLYVSRIPSPCSSFFTILTSGVTPLCHPDPFLCLTLGPPSSSHASCPDHAIPVRRSILLAPEVRSLERQPAPVARSAGIRGIFEPVHDGRLHQGRTFLLGPSRKFYESCSGRFGIWFRGSTRVSRGEGSCFVNGEREFFGVNWSVAKY